MVRNIIFILLLLIAADSQAQNRNRRRAKAQPTVQTKVSQEAMRNIYNKVRTPYKYGLVVAPESNDRKVDCPTVFRQGDMWYMTYVCYNGSNGTNGRGYETWIAESKDLHRRSRNRIRIGQRSAQYRTCFNRWRRDQSPFMGNLQEAHNVV